MMLKKYATRSAFSVSLSGGRVEGTNSDRHRTARSRTHRASRSAAGTSHHACIASSVSQTTRRWASRTAK